MRKGPYSSAARARAALGALEAPEHGQAQDDPNESPPGTGEVKNRKGR